VDLVSRFFWCRFFVEVEVSLVLPLAGSCGTGFLSLSFPSEDEGLSFSVVTVVGWRKSIAVSDLYRGRVGGIVSFADAFTPAETECDRRRPSLALDGAASNCVVGEGGDMSKVVVTSESEG